MQGVCENHEYKKTRNKQTKIVVVAESVNFHYMFDMSKIKIKSGDDSWIRGNDTLWHPVSYIESRLAFSLNFAPFRS